MKRLIIQTCRRRIALALLALGVLVLFPRSAAADRKVYLNGIDLADVDVRGHRFEGCVVEFDDKGNVHITVKGIQIGTTNDKTTDKAAGDEQGSRYFLVVKPVRTNGDKYQLSVYINGQMFKVLHGTPQMQVHDVTRYVKPGDNQVRLVAAQIVGGDGKAVPSEDFELVLGSGVIQNGMVVIQTPKVEYRRKAGDDSAYDKEHRFIAK